MRNKKHILQKLSIRRLNNEEVVSLENHLKRNKKLLRIEDTTGDESFLDVTRGTLIRLSYPFPQYVGKEGRRSIVLNVYGTKDTVQATYNSLSKIKIFSELF